MTAKLTGCDADIRTVIESFNGRLCEECLNAFVNLDDARKRIEAWRTDYNTVRPHSAPGQLAPDQFRQLHQPKNGKLTNLRMVYSAGKVTIGMNSPDKNNSLHRVSEEKGLLDHAVSLLLSGRPGEALTAVSRILEHAPRNGMALNIAGGCSHSLGRMKEAEDYWHRALTEDPGDASVNYNLGRLLMEMKRFAEAEVAYRQALASRPGWIDAHVDLGGLLRETGRFSEAEAAFQRALEIQPRDARAHNNRGNLLYEMKRFAEAEAAYRSALEIRPDYVEAQSNLGNLLKEQKRFAEAEAASRCALEIRPNWAEGHFNLGSLLFEVERFAEAEAAYRRALEIRPDYVEAQLNLGILLYRAGHFVEAEAIYRRTLEIRPDWADAHFSLGNLLYDVKRFAEAEVAYRRALTIRPDYAEARCNFGLLLLHTGRFSEGWVLYEARYDGAKRSAGVHKPALDYPQWNGESPEGKSIVVFCEQGFGDAIQFVRYLPLLKAKGARRITLICPPPVRALFDGFEGADAVLTLDEIASLPAHDYWSYLLSLPLHFATTLDSIPIAIPYVQPTADRLDAWEARLPVPVPVPVPALRIGLVWKGSATHGNDRNRSLPNLATLAPLWDIPGLQFVSLQKGQGEDEAASPLPGQPLTHLGADIRDFADSAAIIARLDLVICVDTAIAHLAGTLGKPCWVLLPSVGTDWRWLEDRTDSPWYPGTMRLFRQRDPGDWAPTIQEVANALRAFVHMTSPVENAPDRASAIRNALDRAVSLFSSGRLRDALAAATQLLEWDPGSGVALNIAGACAHSLGRLNEAEDFWRRALTQNPDDADRQHQPWPSVQGNEALSRGGSGLPASVGNST